MNTRTVWRTPRAGALRRLRLLQEPPGELAPEKIRIATRAAGLNFADIFALTGLYSATPEGSFIPGLEFSGVVQETGAKTSAFAPGDAVMGVVRFGGYASVIDVDPAHCMALPPNWSFPQGAAYPAQTLTAWYALRVLGDVKPQHTVLVQSAAGGVGLQAMRICRRIGAGCVGAVGTEAKRKFLREQGFADVVVRGPRFRADVQRALAGRSLSLALDAVGGRTQKETFDLLAPTGRLVVFGAAEFTPGKNRPNWIRAAGKYLARPRYDPLDMISANKSVLGFNLIWLWERLDLLGPLVEELNAMELEPPFVGKEFPFAEAPQALEHLRSGKSMGKVVLVV